MVNKEAIARMRAQVPLMRATDIAQVLGITREAVRQNLVKLELPTKVGVKRYCRGCNTKINLQNQSGLCSPCLKKSKSVTLTCDECGRQFTRTSRLVKAAQRSSYKHQFCGRRCLGKRAGRLYGKGQQKTFDWKEIRRLDTAGYTGRAIAKQLGISQGHVSKIRKVLGLRNAYERRD